MGRGQQPTGRAGMCSKRCIMNRWHRFMRKFLVSHLVTLRRSAVDRKPLVSPPAFCGVKIRHDSSRNVPPPSLFFPSVTFRQRGGGRGLEVSLAPFTVDNEQIRRSCSFIWLFVRSFLCPFIPLSVQSLVCSAADAAANSFTLFWRGANS